MREHESSHDSSHAADVILISACGAALATLVPVALYQTGITPSLPDPPFQIFDSEKITSSKAAHPLGLPDSLLGLLSFGTTLALIVMARRSPPAKQLLGFKLTADAGAAAFNASRQIISFGKLCSWCTGTAIAAGVMAFAGCTVIRESWSSALPMLSRAHAHTEN